MACFIVPAAEAAIVTIAEKTIKKTELHTDASEAITTVDETVIPLSSKLKWLSNLLWGGSALLMFEHIWHGEVVPWFPFLTAMSDPSEAMQMFHEMATVGVSMSVLVSAIWFVMCKVADSIAKRPATEKSNRIVA